MVLDILAVVVTFVVVALVSWPIGLYIAAVMSGKRTFLSPVIRPIEKGVYKICSIDENAEQNWKRYATAFLTFSVVSIVVTYTMLRTQQWLPLNPEHFANVPPALAFNTIISFVTNTNWQNYAGEQTMSYFSQMVALVFHQFFSAAAGVAIAVALVRGLTRKSADTIGNFFVDIIRCVLYILIPISVVIALILVSQGAIQNLSSYTHAHTIQGAMQVIAQGPVASMEAIKELGTNGGGFMNANSAHPFENPNGFTNMLEVFTVLLIPFGLTFTFGKMVGNLKQGISIAAAMWIVLIISTGIMTASEQGGNPLLNHLGVTQTASATQSGGNMEGKEVRFGSIQSAAFNASTTGTSTGAVDSSMDSYTPLGGMIAMVQMQLGEITPGGVGSGLYGMLLFAIVSVFIAGLMVGRTPEYLGKKIEGKEIKLASIAILFLPLSILGLTAIAVLTPAGRAGPLNVGPHGFSEMLYAFTSATGNNGSAFAGLNGNTDFYNIALAIGFWMGRFFYIVPVIALAGALAKKKIVPASAGTLPTDTPLFTVLVVGVIIIVGALTFFPVLALGPILDHLQLFAHHIAS